MDGYTPDIEGKMQRFFGWLSEKDRRRYAAVDAAKLGHGESSISHGYWGAIRKPFVKASASRRRQRMRQWGASESKGRTPAAHRRPAGLRGEPPIPVAGVHCGRFHACRRAVDEPVAARVVTTPGGAGDACQPPHDPALAQKTQMRLPHSAQEKTMGRHPGTTFTARPSQPSTMIAVPRARAS
jgi:hypothetical protein